MYKLSNGIPLLAAGTLLCSVGSAEAYFQVYDYATAVGGSGASFIDSIVVDGTTAYNIMRTGENVVTKVTDVGGTNTSSVLTTDAVWGAFSSNAIAGLNGADVTGSTLRFANFFDNSVQSVALGSGTPSSYATEAQLLASLGLVSADFNISANSAVSGSGEVAFYNSDSGARLIAITTGPGAATSVLDQAGITALTGGSTLSGGMSFVGDDLYFASNTADGIFKVDTSAPAGGSAVLTQADIIGVTGETAASFGDFFTGGDGNVYFYEATGDGIMSFDPTDPVNTLTTVITEAELLAGPANSDLIGNLTWFDGNIAWSQTSSSSGRVRGLYSIPEPASLALMGLGGLLALRRR